MHISEMIARLNELQSVHGDLEVMGRDYDSDAVWLVGSLVMKEVAEGEYPKNWNMPEGYKFIMVQD